MIAAVLTARREGRLAVTVLPAAVGLAMAVQYLLLLGYSTPRFLLPSYALLALPIADALLLPPRRARTPSARRRGVAAVSGDEAPPIAYYSGCASHVAEGGATSSTAAGLLQLSRRLPVAVVQTGRQRPPRFARHWRTVRLHTTYATWKVRVFVPRR